MSTHVLVAGGTVQAVGGLYLERAADQELLEACLKGDFAYVLTSRQMGKSSLLVNAVERLAGQGVRSVFVDLTVLGTDLDSDQWYRGLLETIEIQLNLTPRLVSQWATHAELSIAHRFQLFLLDVVRRNPEDRIVVFVDEIDTTLRLSFTDDFFAGIRYCYNARALQPELRRLSFVLSGVASPSDLIKDSERTPFNIGGRRIELRDFSLDEASPLAAFLPVPLERAHAILERVLSWTGGHPYLTLSLVRALAAAPSADDVDTQVRQLFLGPAGERDSNIRYVSDMLTKSAPQKEATLRLYGDIRRGKRVTDVELDQIIAWLRLSGAVRRKDVELVVRNRIYERVFDVPWVKRHLPLYIDWRKRMVTALQIVLMVSVVPLIILIIVAARNASEARRQAKIAQDAATAASVNADAANERSALGQTTIRQMKDFLQSKVGPAIPVIGQKDPALADALRGDITRFGLQLDARTQEFGNQPTTTTPDEVTSLKAEKTGILADNARLTKENQTLKDQLKAVPSTPAPVDASRDATITQLQKQISDLRSQDEKDKADANERVKALQKRIDDLPASNHEEDPDRSAIEQLLKDYGHALNEYLRPDAVATVQALYARPLNANEIRGVKEGLTCKQPQVVFRLAQPPIIKRGTATTATAAVDYVYSCAVNGDVQGPTVTQWTFAKKEGRWLIQQRG